MKSVDRLANNMIDFPCPCCNSRLSFPEVNHGTAQECPFCFETIIVPPIGSANGGKLPIPIQTQRLNLRPMTTGDLSDWLEFISDEDSYKYLFLHPPPDGDDAVSWLETSIRIRLTQPNGRLDLGIEMQNTSKLIGYLSFFIRDTEEHRQGNFQIMINPAYRRQGYGTEAIGGILDFGFNGLAMHDIRITIDNRNMAGRRMVEKAGMKQEGEIVEAHRIKGDWMSIVYYGTLSAWWNEKTRS